MSRLTLPRQQAIDPKAQRVLRAIRSSLGFVPNMLRSMASAPAVLLGYTQLSSTLAGGNLSAELREKIALLVAQENACEYCVAAHSTTAGAAGLSLEAILDARRGTAVGRTEQAGLDFARAVLEHKGAVADTDLADVRAAGYRDGDIAEIVANVVLTIYSNYFNKVAETEIDFRRVLPVAAVATAHAA